MIIARKYIKPQWFYGGSGRLASNEYHKHCSAGIEDGERVLCDFVSMSDHLLKDTVDVIIPPGLREDKDNDVE